MIFQHKPDFSQIIQGLSTQNMDIDYEQAIFKKVCDCFVEDKKQWSAHGGEPFYFKYLNEAVFNTNFYNLAKMDAKSLRDFSDEVKKTIAEYMKQEEEMFAQEDDEFDFSDDSEEDYGTESEQDSADEGEEEDEDY
jgi:hypothetical protein